jgi:hypothetical protein
MSRPLGLATSLLGLGFAVAGFDKLVGVTPYRNLARHWGWSDGDMRALGAAELAGGALVAWHPTRRLGGALLAAASAAALVEELQHRDNELALPRFGLFTAAMLATIGPL